MRKNKHFLYYSFLLFILSVGIFLSFQTSYSRDLQIDVLIMTSAAYVLWGIFHHILHHDIAVKIVIEYVLIAILGVASILLLIKGGL